MRAPRSVEQLTHRDRREHRRLGRRVVAERHVDDACATARRDQRRVGHERRTGERREVVDAHARRRQPGAWLVGAGVHGRERDEVDVGAGEPAEQLIARVADVRRQGHQDLQPSLRLLQHLPRGRVEEVARRMAGTEELPWFHGVTSYRTAPRAPGGTVVAVSRPARRSVPGRSPLGAPSSTSTRPFTTTHATPSAAEKSRPAPPGRSWRVRTVPGPTVAGSNTTRSAWYPQSIRPRSRRPKW